MTNKYIESNWTKVPHPVPMFGRNYNIIKHSDITPKSYFYIFVKRVSRNVRKGKAATADNC